MPDIVLTTLNAKYIHAGIGLRYLRANLNELRTTTLIQEFTISDRPIDIVEQLLALKPRIIGIGVYIWNALQVEQLTALIKAVAPEVFVVLGGPEASHPPLRFNSDNCDYIICGEGEISFHTLCSDILGGEPPSEKIIPARLVDAKQLILPYREYTDEDVLQRIIYVEASRGCPFHCEFCLSSIEKSIRYFEPELFLGELEELWQRGCRNIKFIDRTFNLNIDQAITILDFFLEKEPPFLVHFEVIPEHFPQQLKNRLQQFQPGTLQLEVGIQTLNPTVANNINRKMDFEKITRNLAFLERETSSHLHVDLIIGLPGENKDSFADNLNQLTRLTSAEIQIGILKKLSGTTINRHDEQHKMVYSPYPPYEILANDCIDFATMQQLKRFSRYWDMVYNSGNFRKSIKMLWEQKDVYQGFSDFSLWIFEQTSATWKISLQRMAVLLFTYLTEELGFNQTLAADTIAADIQVIQGRRLPAEIKDHLSVEMRSMKRKQKQSSKGKRQAKHL